MNLFARFAQLKKLVGGNREKPHFEFTFGASVEELNGVTRPNADIMRVLSELNFALQMNDAQQNIWAEDIDRALLALEACMKEHGVLTRGACAQAEEALLPLAKEAKRYEVLYIAHAHIDMNWMWGWHETVAVTISTFQTMLNLMREYPDFTFSQSQASVYKIIEEYAPEMMDEIRARIEEGRWEVTASAWVETDKNMPDTESLLRHIRLTRDYLHSVWGVDPDKVKVDFSPDTFGHSRFVPEINTFGGVPYYYHCRGLQDDLTLYRYRAPSGKEVLVYKEPYWYNSGVNPDNGTGAVELSRRCAGLKTAMVVYGVGDHGGGPTRRDVERVLEMRDWPVFPTLRFGTLDEFFKKAESVREQLPVIDHELNAIFAGCYTTQSRIKMANRRAEAALLDAEKLCALGSFKAPVGYPAGRLDQAWQKVLFTHFHDILTGSCVQESREHAMGVLSEALAHAQTEQARACRLLSEAVDTSMFPGDAAIADSLSEGAGVGFGLGSYAGVPNPERGAGKTRVYTVFNPASTPRKEPVECVVWDYAGDLRRLRVIDCEGNDVRFQLLDKTPQHYWSHHFVRVLIEAQVPALGYAAYAICESPVESYPTYRLTDDRVERPMGEVVLENEFIRARFHGGSGELLSLFDKQTGREALKAGAGLRLIQTEQATSDAWHIGRHLSSQAVDETVRLYAVQGELRSQLVMEHKVMRSTVKTTVSLDAGARALKYALEVDWNEAANAQQTVPVLSFCAPVGESDAILCDVPAGFITRAAKAMDVPALSFAQANGTALITDCKYGYRLSDGVLSATLINTAIQPDPYPERGIHHIQLWISADQAGAVALKRRAEACVRPMIAAPTGVHAGKLPPRDALAAFEAEGCVLSSIQRTSDQALLARAFESRGQAETVKLRVPFTPARAQLVDLFERPVGEARVEGGCVSFEIEPWSLAAVKIYPA